MSLTMARVWFSVIVIICTRQVFANYDDYDDEKFLTCDQCIRVGSLWCSEPNSLHCVSRSEREDGWCKTKHPEILEALTDETRPNISGISEYIQKSIKVGIPDNINIDLKSSNKTDKDVRVKIISSTQNPTGIVITTDSKNCINKPCVTVKVIAGKNFCTANGTNMEYFEMEISVDDLTKTIVKYHVPCACKCSLQKEKDSFWCHKHGDFACGVCICHKGWTGKHCNQVKVEGSCKDRGDIVDDSSSYVDNGLNCSGNGNFGECDNCICDETLEGAQYFNQPSKCGSICQLTNSCDSCIQIGAVGSCGIECHFPMTIQKLNKSLLSEKDIFDRTVWIHCNVTVGDCNVKYTAMSKDNVEIFVMVEPCTPEADPLVSESASIALGIVALILLVAAAAGMVLWKHLHSVPPLPSTDMQYHNIDAEDCTGVNPLYIDPCSSFKNPMYGK